MGPWEVAETAVVIGTRARYSLRFMLAVGKLSINGEPIGLGEISHHSGISRRYLDQLVVALRNASLVHGRSGRSGGYVLARAPDDIKLSDIIEAAIGPIAITDCVSEPESCLSGEFCKCRDLWTLISYRIKAVLDEFTLADMLDQDWPAEVQRELAAIGSERHLIGL